MSTFPTTTTKDASLFDWHFFLGAQVDAMFDTPTAVDLFRQHFNELVEAANRSVVLHWTRYPVHPPFRDITWKWNMIINEAYLAGCDFMF